MRRFNENEVVRVKENSPTARVYPELVGKKLVIIGFDGAVATTFDKDLANLSKGEAIYEVKPDGEQDTWGVLEGNLDYFEILDV